MTQPYELVAIVTILALLTYLWTGLRVAGARAKFGVQAPATTGNPEFERYFRVQMNTLEWLPLFLVPLWLFAGYWGQTIAAAIGLVWVAGRILYALFYVRNPQSRGIGFSIQALAALVLLIGAIAGIVRAMMATGGA